MKSFTIDKLLKGASVELTCHHAAYLGFHRVIFETLVLIHEMPVSNSCVVIT
jgi:hypothetical protein